MLLSGPAAILYALFVWWFSTGLVLWIVRLPRFVQPWTLFFATLVMMAGLFGLSASSHDASAAGVFQAFTCAVLVWAWQEIAFLLGLVTGPRKLPLTHGARGGARTREAVATVLYHELALVGTGAAVVVATWEGTNPVGLWTFAVLWVMRLSAKLNLFLGVPNRSEGFLPEHLRYLASYFADRPINLLFPLSITGATVAAVVVVERIFDPLTSGGEAAGLALVATLLVLAIVEHWLLVLPLPAETLWRWGLAGEAARGELASAAPYRAQRAWRRPALDPRPATPARLPAAPGVPSPAAEPDRPRHSPTPDPSRWRRA